MSTASEKSIHSKKAHFCQNPEHQGWGEDNSLNILVEIA